ncbi:Uma2 family endonuclease [Iningainema tapete]|uniref:Uma2 family endonuclease n=1 Tax=Iningainema tapete BLCC-T55 TaxID=2748662 RepID=A0A8J6XHB9_9CYAN|nr:Uma2 family endonuclease [Iningainema tapete]MBD2774368.1 Uma2 family endonuclease [Iningainema tapete BLCC-T55]
MSVAQDLETSKDVIFPPSNLYSNEPPFDSDLHMWQMIVLMQSLEWLWHDRNDFYAIGNLTIYYSLHQPTSRDFRGPDFFVVLGTQRKIRNSWVVWHEGGKYPNVIVEILSDSTAKTDKGLKKEIYQDTFRTPNYFWYDPKTLEFAGFILIGGSYQPIEPNQQGWLWSQQLDLYLGIHETKLRFFTSDGQLVPTLQEVAQIETQRAEQEKQRAEQEKQRAEQEKQRADRLAEKLRELNIDLDTF